VHFSRIIFSDDEKFYNFLKVIVYFAVADAIFAIFSKFTGFRYSTSFPSHSLGFFSHPNTHSFVFTISLPVLFFLYFDKKIRLSFFLISLFLLAYNLMTTYSRTGMIITAFAVLLVTFFYSKKVFFISVALILVSASIVVANINAVKTDSSLSRALLILAAIQMILESPFHFFWGYGLFEAIEVFKTEKVFLGSLEIVVDPHNLILLLGIQFGMLVPLISLVIYFYVIIKSFLSIKKLKKTENFKKIILALSLCLGLFLQNMFEDIIVYPEYFVMPIFLVFLGYLYCNIKLAEGLIHTQSSL